MFGGGAMKSAVPMHRLDRSPNYDAVPRVEAGSPSECAVGWQEICSQIRGTGARVVLVETYTGVADKDIALLLNGLGPDVSVDTTDAFKHPEEIEEMVEPDVTSDRVFGCLTRLHLRDFLSPARFQELRSRVDRAAGTVVVHGPGASLIVGGDLLIYAGMPRWEGQLRQRMNEAANLGLENHGERPSTKYKRGFFVDWRVLDRHRRTIWDRIDFVLDTTDHLVPKMISSASLYRALQSTARRPFRVVPYFDPAPWGGHWIEKVCGIETDKPNLGWCFDCVPEENSLLLGFGSRSFEVPSVDLVFREPRMLLGESVYGRFGAEFPIRFDFLDTMEGGNLSMQVHPLTEYIQQNFGMNYTQDESYYLLDAGEGASVYLGLKNDAEPDAMIADLRRAEEGDYRFPDERYINRFPAKKHDHFLIPAGTVHCSGANSMVLEISATPYIFTFKLWDWDRLGLDGKPRPLHIGHGERSIQWHRKTEYARTRLINRVRRESEGEGWTEESTGLHEAEFIETRRHWFTRTVPHETNGLNVLNLVEGDEAVVESPDGAFDPFVVHYAETFIVPSAAGPYTIRPHGPAEGSQCATIKAFVRTKG